MSSLAAAGDVAPAPFNNTTVSTATAESRFSLRRFSLRSLGKVLRRFNIFTGHQHKITATAPSSPITLVCISDVHSLPLPAIPDGDVLILAGDLSEGRPAQLLSRLGELSSLTNRFQHIIVIGGNHDRALSAACDTRDAAQYSDHDERIACRHAFQTTPGITYLENSGVVIKVCGRELMVWGLPGSLSKSTQTAFGYREEEADKLWAQIPEGVDVLVTHGPPRGYLDAGMGCAGLTRALWRIKPRVHVFGHVHQGHGSVVLRYDEIQREYEKALASVKETEVGGTASEGRYVPPHLRKKEARVQVELPAKMWDVPKEPPVKGETTVLVNAAFMGGSETERDPIRVLV
jgi:Icc-related predicted phosphoesterase